MGLFPGETVVILSLRTKSRCAFGKERKPGAAENAADRNPTLAETGAIARPIGTSNRSVPPSS